MYYWNIQARNSKSGKTVMQQDNTGYREIEESRAWDLATAFAQKMSTRSRETWEPKIVWTQTTDR